MAGKFMKQRMTKKPKVKRALKGNEGDSDGSSDFDVKEGDNCEANEDVQEYDDDGSEDEGDGSLGETSDEEDDPHSDDVTETLEEASSGGVSRKRKLVEIENGSTPSLSKKKKKTKSSSGLQKPPSAQEVARLRETENLFHSSLFRLQIDEMLNELRIKKKRLESFSDWFLNLKQSLLEMKSGKQHELMKQGWLKKLGLSIPLVQEPYESKGVFNFFPPSAVYIIGSHAIGCSLGPYLNVDIAIEMPTKCFQGSDHINYRYQRKRALYLCKVLAHLKSAGVISFEEEYAPRFELSRAANPLIPIAVVVPIGTLQGHARVHLHMTVPEETFKLSKLSPSKNSVRSEWFFSEEKDDEEKESATPVHNASILCDLVAKKNEAVILDMLQELKNLKDGIVLLKVWMRQRELDKGLLTFGSYLMTMLVIYLLRSRRLSSHMSSYQVARTVWNFLKESDWTLNGLTLCDKPPAGAPSLQEFHNNYDVVFVDCTGYYNLAAHLDASSFLMVKAESALAIQCLDNPSVNSFQALFMKPAPFYRRFDHVLCFHNLEPLLQMNERVANKENKLDKSRHPLLLTSTLLMAVLQKGLGKRVAEWGIQVPKSSSWKIDSLPLQAVGPILIGINLNSEYAYSIVDKGPPADLPEAEEFRKFWGSKSELRRFQDGSISEAVVWLLEKDVTLSQRRTVNRVITEYLLLNKLGLNPTETVVYLADQLEEILTLSKVKPSSFSYGTGEEATLAVLSALDRLSSELRGLSDLPLDISGIHGSSPVCRYTDVFPPLATVHQPGKKITIAGEKCILLRTGQKSHMAPIWNSPVEVVIQLALSGKWPEDAQAVRRVRAAFSIKIAGSLQTQCGLTTQAFPNHVDVLKDGFVFRLRVAYQREPALLRQCIMPDGLVKVVDCKEAQVLEKEIIHIPRITSYLHGLHQQQPAFGPAACLAKRWISAHMIRWTLFPEEAVELLMAHLFLSPEPFCVPAQPQSAFMRFLHLLSSTNWHLEPLILNFNNELNKDNIVEIERRFTADRAQLPALFIATPSERENSVWTKEAPNLTILARVAFLASESLKVLQSYYVAVIPSEVNMWKQVFRPSLDSFNVIIYLRSGMNPRRSQWIDTKLSENPQALEPYKKIKGEKLPVTGYDPVQCYLKELEEAYSEFALFFHDIHGGNTIGVVWKPSGLQPKEFKITHINGRSLEDNKAGSAPQLIVNKEVLIEDFYVLGQGLVLSIEVKDSSV